MSTTAPNVVHKCSLEKMSACDGNSTPGLDRAAARQTSKSRAQTTSFESRPHGFTSSQRFGVQRTISVGIKRRTGRATLCRLRASVHGNRHSSVRKERVRVVVPSFRVGNPFIWTSIETGEGNRRAWRPQCELERQFMVIARGHDGVQCLLQKGLFRG